MVAKQSDRLDRLLVTELPAFSRTRLAALISEGKVLVDGQPRKPSFHVEAGMRVCLDAPEPRAAHDLTPSDIPLDVVYEDEAILVVNKPRGLASHPARSLREPTLVNALLARPHDLSEVGPPFRPGIVHRLDKETTGLLLVAKTDFAHLALARQIEARSVSRIYVALARGRVEQDSFRIEAAVARDRRDRRKMAIDAGGRSAVTHGRVLNRDEMATLLALKLETGRTHQIRVHLASIGHPVVGDSIYGSKGREELPLQLHATLLAFDHPVTGERVELYAAPPLDFARRDAVSRTELEAIWV
ncbi:MAG: RluA family pseudouridine synthase [Fimbriimonas ginsengisoli]|uniref:Pseudouridine synthase n=1 Tax=Fimbriimonas ginsengisoli TaxID=1005039 RepID=A0A931PWJ3_FIMGI|nr:RluA family pseudouridine synthase [Fimbriimonas ginsengisoli]